MTQDPLSPELGRLVEQGRARQAQQRAMEASQEARLRAEGYRHLRVAIGGYRGSRIRRIVLALMLLGPVVGGVCLATDVLPLAYAAYAIGVSWPMFFLYVFLPPIASKSALVAEEAWARSLPFELRGYFETLAADPQPVVRLMFEVTWRAGVRPPDATLVLDACRAVDPAAQVDAVTPRGLRITSGEISGHTGIRHNRVPVYRNHRIPAPAHALVDTVLATLHGSYPIETVTVARWSTAIDGRQLLAFLSSQPR